MTTITQVISTAPPAPSWQRPNDFPEEADAFVLYLSGIDTEINTWAGQVNTVAGEINTAIGTAVNTTFPALIAEAAAEAATATSKATIATSAANAAALSANATIYDSGNSYSAGDVVFDPDDSYTAYTSQQDSNTNHTPNSDDGTWWVATLKPDISGGAEVQDISAHTTLTSLSKLVQIISPSLDGLFVSLPDATTKSKGFAYIIHNNSDTHSFYLKDYDGSVLDKVNTNSSAILLLIDNAASAGTWTISGFADSSEFNGVWFGDTDIFASTAVTYTSVCGLSESKALVCYDMGTAGQAAVINVDSNNQITSGTPTTYESVQTAYTSVCALSDTKAIVGYYDSGNSYYGTACVLGISGSTITAGTPAAFNSVNTAGISIAKLSSTKAIAVYCESTGSYYAKACILNIEGDTIIPVSPVTIKAAQCIHSAVTALSETRAIAVFNDSSNSNLTTAVLLNISGDTITTVGSPLTVFAADAGYYHSIRKLTSTKALVCAKNYSTSKGRACTITMTADTITAGTSTDFETASATYISVTQMSETEAIVSYLNSTKTYACKLSIDGTTITAGQAIEIAQQTAYTSISALSGSRAICCYRNASGSNYGTAIALGIS